GGLRGRDNQEGKEQGADSVDLHCCSTRTFAPSVRAVSLWMTTRSPTFTPRVTSINDAVLRPVSTLRFQAAPFWMSQTNESFPSCTTAARGSVGASGPLGATISTSTLMLGISSAASVTAHSTSATERVPRTTTWEGTWETVPFQAAWGR